MFHLLILQSYEISTTFHIINACFFSVHSQKPPQTKVDSMLVNIDKSEFSTGILYDRTVPWANLNSFNDNKNISSVRYFEQALEELYRGSNEKKFKSYKTIRRRYVPDSIINMVDIGIINAAFDQLFYIEGKEEEGALRIANGKFEKIPNGKPAFIKKHALIISPLKEYLVGNEITYHFDNFFLIESYPDKEIVKISANFDTPTDYVVYNNGQFIHETLQVRYGESGYKILTFTANFSDGTSQNTQAVLHVKIQEAIIPPNLPIKNGVVDASLPFQGIKGHLEYRIFYGNPQGVLLKPIIIIDGFDPGDKRKIQDSDSPEPPDEHRSIEDMMRYSSPPNDVRIIDTLQSLNYDVVVVNHPTYSKNGQEIDGGADYIERNALTHVSLYQALNDTLAQNNSTEKLVIVGPSMGGQISRYALAYMEKENIPHNTRLWVSVDSPHLGANIPIGLQSLINQVAETGNTMAQDFVSKDLGSPAAKQQLIEQFNGWNGSQLNQDYLNARTLSQGYTISRGRPSFIGFYNNLFYNGLYGSIGYPQNLRKIAIVNGSLNGKRKFFNPFTQQQDNYIGHNEMGVNVRAFQYICVPFPCWSLHIGSLEAYNLANYNSYGKISRFKKAFNDDSKYTTNINSRGNMDNVPGGWFPGFDEVASPINGTDPLPPNGSFWSGSWFDNILSDISDFFGWATMTVYKNEHVHSFIPTASSLGFINPDFNWAQAFKRNLVCPGNKEIPFDTYFGPRNNEQHTSFTEKSVHWLLEELAGNPQPPTIHLDSEDMSGPAVICGTDTVTYSFDFCESLPVIAWEVSNNLIKTTPLTDYNRSIIVQPVHASTNGWAYVKAIFASPNEPVQKNIWIGPPKVDFVEDVNVTQINHTMPIVPQGSCDEFGLKVNISPSFSNVQEMEWEKVSTNYQWSQDPPGYNDPYVIIAPLCEDPVQFQVRMRNDCGWSDWQQIEDTNSECQTNCGGGGGGSGTITSDYFIIYPVPADTVLHVNMIGTDPTDLLIAGDTLTIQLFNSSGMMVKNINTIACHNSIDVSTLPAGLYTLKIIYNGTPENHQIVIN